MTAGNANTPVIDTPANTLERETSRDVFPELPPAGGGAAEVEEALAKSERRAARKQARAQGIDALKFRLLGFRPRPKHMIWPAVFGIPTTATSILHS